MTRLKLSRREGVSSGEATISAPFLSFCRRDVRLQARLPKFSKFLTFRPILRRVATVVLVAVFLVAATFGIRALIRIASHYFPTSDVAENISVPGNSTESVQNGPPSTPPIPVRTAVATSGSVETFRRFRGFTNIDPIKIVPRVRGSLESVEFSPGSVVEKGDVLFRVESFDYRNAVDAARSELDAAIAREARAQATHRRNLRLQQNTSVSGIVTEETVETSRAALQEASAAVSKARAALEFAEKQLERTVIRAPSRGQIGRPLLPVGSFVDGSAVSPPSLATLVSMNPMRVYFYATDREYLDFQQRKRNEIKSYLGDLYDVKKYDDVALVEILKEERWSNFVEFDLSIPGLDPPGVYSRRGVVNYVDNVFDRSTGVVALRGDVENADYSIYPGVVCDLRVRGETLENATLIDKRAVSRDLNSHFIWLVDAENHPRRQTVELGRETPDGTQIVVLKGVAPGDRYVVDGILKIRPGAQIIEAPAESAPATDSRFDSDDEPPKS